MSNKFYTPKNNPTGKLERDIAKFFETALVLWLLLRPIYKILIIGLVVLTAWYMVDGRYTYDNSGSYPTRVDRLTGNKEIRFSTGWTEYNR
jgi:hypothetical protein